MTPIERAARALCAIDDADPDATLGGDGQNPLWREYANVHVRAVLLAIREPSEGMVEAAEGGDDPGSSIYGDPFVPLPHREAWQAMIDAAVTE